MSFLLDTDICSAHLKTHPIVTAKIMQYAGRLAISVITLAELSTWAQRAKSHPQLAAQLQMMVDDLIVYAIDPVLAARFGALRALQLDAGRPMPVRDLWIAVTGLECQLTLVTHNMKGLFSYSGSGRRRLDTTVSTPLHHRLLRKPAPKGRL